METGDDITPIDAVLDLTDAVIDFSEKVASFCLDVISSVQAGIEAFQDIREQHTIDPK